MELKVHLKTYNAHPVSGILIKGASFMEWFPILQLFKIDLDRTKVYAIAGSTAGDLYGCLVLCDVPAHWKKNYGSSVIEIQSVHNHLYIPAGTTITPAVNPSQVRALSELPLVYLPFAGWQALEKPVSWGQYLKLPSCNNSQFSLPPARTFIPRQVLTIQAIARTEKELEEELSTRDERRKNAKLNMMEKIQLGVLKSLFKVGFNKSGNYDFENRPLGRLFNKMTGGNNAALQSRIERLMDRNVQGADKLLALLSKNPKLLGRLGIPLDVMGAGRGGSAGLLGLGNGGNITSIVGNIIKWMIRIFCAIFFLRLLFSTNDSSSPAVIIAVLMLAFFVFMATSGIGSRSENSNGNTAYLESERMRRLRERYEEIINLEKKEGNFKEAARLQIKLLKDYYAAAETLEEGKLYQEAAYLYLKRCSNIGAAARCYEKAQIYQKAIDLHLQNNDLEKAADLYLKINDVENAHKYFNQAAEKLIKSTKYIEAAHLYDDKLNDLDKSQDTLLQGWLKKARAKECLLKYFEQLPDHQKGQKIPITYRRYVDKSNVGDYLKVIKEFSDAHKDYTGQITDLSYEIISSYHDSKPELAKELQSLLPENVIISNDINSFVRKKNKSRKKNRD